MLDYLWSLLRRGGLVYFLAAAISPFLSSLLAAWFLPQNAFVFVVGLTLLLYLDCIWVLEAVTRHYWGLRLANPSHPWLQTIFWSVLGVFTGVGLATLFI